MSSCHVNGHVKVFSIAVIDTFPAQSPWICSVCFAEGADRDELPGGETYGQVHARKRDAASKGGDISGSFERPTVARLVDHAVLTPGQLLNSEADRQRLAATGEHRARILARLAAVWALWPESRLGQILTLVAPFYATDDALISAIEKVVGHES